jgi:hypothetical protein
MNYYTIIEGNFIRGFQALGNSEPNVAEGQTAYPISRETFDTVRGRDRQNTSLLWDSDLQTVLVVDRSEDELAARAWSDLRAKRDGLLAGTDLTQLPDFPKKELYTEYRQALRDLPGNTADPFNPVWPELSEEARSYLKGK